MAKAYLISTFMDDVELFEIRKTQKLPNYIIQNFKLYRMIYHNADYIVIEFINETFEQNSKSLKQIDKIKELFENQKVVLVTPEITIYYSKLLMKSRLDFIVPGKLIYLPSLALVYNEVQLTKYKNRSTNSEKQITQFTPTTQAVLFTLMILREKKWNLTTLADYLNVSKMSVSRAVQVLKNQNLLIESQGRANATMLIDLKLKTDQILEDYESYFINPIIKTVTVDRNLLDTKVISEMVESGQSALTRYTMIGSPEHETFSIEKNKWIEPKESYNKYDFDTEDVITIEIWKHMIIRAKTSLDKPSVHPVELYISLKKNLPYDDRIDIAINDLLKDRIYKGVNKL